MSEAPRNDSQEDQEETSVEAPQESGGRDVTPLVAVPDDAPEIMQAVLESGGEPDGLSLRATPPDWGVALVREWIADTAHLELVVSGASALLIPDGPPERLAGLVTAALRAEIPAILDAPLGGPSGTPSGGVPAPFSASLAGLGMVPFSGEEALPPVQKAVEIAEAGKPTARRLISSFSLANALRAGLSLGGGAETIIHLAALGREAGVTGSARMLRVLIPETPVIASPDSAWFRERGVTGLLAHIKGSLHHAPMVAGRLKTSLPEAPESLEDAGEEDAGSLAGSRIVLVEGRASATEIPCRQMSGVEEVGGECRVFWSEKEAVSAVENGVMEEGQLLVVGGCGPRGTPGLRRMDLLSGALRDAGLNETAVLTDGLAPDGMGDGTGGVWASLAWPEAAGGGVLARLRDGDRVRLDLSDHRLRANVSAGEMEDRAPGARFGRRGGEMGYAARYVAGHLGPLEGSGFDAKNPKNT